MPTMGFAMWLQEQSGLAHDHHLIMIFIGMIALAIVIMALLVLYVSSFQVRRMEINYTTE